MAGRNNIGNFDQRVTFQSETTADDGQGGVTSSGWANIAATPTMWASVVQSKGSEGEARELRQSNAYSVDIIVRNRDDITDRLAVLWRGRRYNIRSALPYDARREFLLIHAVNGVPL